MTNSRGVSQLTKGGHWEYDVPRDGRSVSRAKFRSNLHEKLSCLAKITRRMWRGSDAWHKGGFPNFTL